MQSLLHSALILLIYFAIAAGTALTCRVFIKILDELFRKILHCILLGSLMVFVFCFDTWWHAAKWIESVLWAHRMQRSNKIERGDNLDTVWAAAYLPFVDYTVTDNAFCELLQNSGLAKQYGTKVYSDKTLSSLLMDLKSILEE